MERKHPRRAQAVDIDYRPSKRVAKHQPKPKSGRGFAYKGHHPREKAQRPRSISRGMLIAGCLEEIRRGGDSIAALYSSLLVGRLAALEPRLADLYEIPVEEIEG